MRALANVGTWHLSAGDRLNEDCECTLELLPSRTASASSSCHGDKIRRRIETDDLRSPHSSFGMLWCPGLPQSDALLPLVCSLGFVSGRSIVGSVMVVSRALHYSLPPLVASLDVSPFAVSPSSLSASLRRFPNLRHVDFSFCSQVTGPVLASLARQLPRLESLRLRSCAQVTDQAVIAVADHCFLLRVLDLGNCRSVTDASLVDLAGRNARLEVVAVDGTGFTAIAVVVIAKRCRNLLDINLVGGRNMDVGVRALAENCKKLQRLNFEKCQGITTSTLVALARLGLNLECINLNLCGRNVTDEAVVALASACHKLREIRLCYSGATDAAVTAIARYCSDLQEVDVSECPITLDATIDNLIQRCRALRHLTVSPRFSEESYIRWSSRVTLIIDSDNETPTQLADEDINEARV